MKPITFVCRASLPIGGAEVGRRILEVENWSDFAGYGPLPGIRRAEFERRTDDVVGSRIGVLNNDGSRHVEEIVEWSGRRIRQVMKEFSAPLRWLATRFEEIWQFDAEYGPTQVVRTFEIYPTCWLARAPLCGIAILLRKAIERHLAQLAGAGPVGLEKAEPAA